MGDIAQVEQSTAAKVCEKSLSASSLHPCCVAYKATAVRSLVIESTFHPSDKLF